MNLKTVYTYVGLSVSFYLVSCSQDDAETSLPYDAGIVVINEGAYGKGNGSLSFLGRETNSIVYDIFKKENAVSLGDVVQSYQETNGQGYAVVNNSNKVEVVNARTFKSVRTVTKDLVQPRYSVVANGKLFVTCWDNYNPDYTFKKGWVSVVDITTFQTDKTISLGKGPEGMIVVGNELFIANSEENFISVIDTQTYALTMITVPNNPVQFVKDTNGKLWILCKGKFGEKSQLVRLNTTTKQLELTLTVGTHPSKKAGNLAIDSFGKTLFFTYNFYDAADGYKYKGEVYSFSINDTSIQTDKPLVNKAFYGLGIDPQTNAIYGALVPSFTQSGYVYRYRISGQLIDSLKAEIGPNGFFFK
ncbi:MAG: DUF5074 domain-containing protein [Spirosomataceae bacterium]